MRTYPTNPALEAAVIASADDDTPRLAYADWLEENGDHDRAAFIRTQVALWDKHPADEDYLDLLERNAYLREDLRISYRLEPECLPEVSPQGSNSLGRDDEWEGFHRGFPFFAEEPIGDNPGGDHARRLRDGLPTLFKTTTLRGFHFSGWYSRQLHIVLDSTYAAELRALCVDNCNSDSKPPIPAVRSVVNSPVTQNLRWLGINHLSQSDVEMLIKVRSRTSLTRLHAGLLSTEAGTKKLFSAGWFSDLRRVQIAFGPENAAAGMASLASLPNLHTIESYGIGPEAIRAFPKAGVFGSLGKLMLHNTEFGARGAASLAKARMPRLAVLALHGCGLEDETVTQLALSPLFTNLRALRLNDPIGDDGIIAVTDSASASELRMLELSGGLFTGRAFKAIASKLPKLTTLVIECPEKKVSAKRVAQFLTDLTCPVLGTLALTFPMSDEAASAIAGNPACSCLTSLTVHDRNRHKEETLTDRGLSRLLTSKYLQRLMRLKLRCSKPDKAAALLLDRKVLPNLQILSLPISDALREKLKLTRPDLWLLPT